VRKVIKTHTKLLKEIPNLQDLIDEYQSGKSLAKISETSGICRRTLSRHFKAKGVEINQDGAKYIYDTHFFDKIDSEEKAYWLGFLYADGSISSSGIDVSLGLKVSDRTHLEKLRDRVSPGKPIAEKQVRLGVKTFGAATYCMTNRVIHDQLIALGCPPRKSLILTFPTEDLVPTSLLRHFIRGYVDGDGSIGLYVSARGEELTHFSVLGTQQFLEGIQDVFQKHIPEYSKSSIKLGNRSKAFFFQKGGRHAVKNILDYLYRDSSISLDRKYNIYLSICHAYQQWYDEKSQKKTGRPKG
jgi:hypothetical protein